MSLEAQRDRIKKAGKAMSDAWKGVARHRAAVEELLDMKIKTEEAIEPQRRELYEARCGLRMTMGSLVEDGPPEEGIDAGVDMILSAVDRLGNAAISAAHDKSSMVEIDFNLEDARRKLVQASNQLASSWKKLDELIDPYCEGLDQEREERMFVTATPCPVCGRISCDHTAEDRGQTPKEMFERVPRDGGNDKLELYSGDPRHAAD